jgi:hypothetical protein
MCEKPKQITLELSIYTFLKMKGRKLKQVLSRNEYQREEVGVRKG